MKKINKEIREKDNKLFFNFDLYTRNYYISQFLESLNRKKLNILDVGGRSGHLAEFVDGPHKVTILDIRESEINEDNYLVGDIVSSNIDDEAFDIVTSCDLYEHIEEKLRLQAVNEMLRISKDIVIIAAPFYSQEVLQAETQLNNYYKKIHNKFHPWLQEHFAFKLPSSQGLESIIKDKNYSYLKFGTNNIELWKILQTFIFSSSKFDPGITEYRKVMEFYNKNLGNLGDNLEPTYRKIYIISKKNSLKSFKTPNFVDLKIPYVFELFKLIIEIQEISSEVLYKKLNFYMNIANEREKVILEKDKDLDYLKEEITQIKNSSFWGFYKNIRKFKGIIRKIR